eukprot:3225200-Prymnesium_polylepis.3
MELAPRSWVLLSTEATAVGGTPGRAVAGCVGAVGCDRFAPPCRLMHTGVPDKSRRSQGWCGL